MAYKTVRRSIVYIDPETKVVIRPLKILHGYKYFIIGVPTSLFDMIAKKGGVGRLLGNAKQELDREQLSSWGQLSYPAGT